MSGTPFLVSSKQTWTLVPKSGQKAGSLMRTGKSEEPLGCVIPDPPESLQNQELAEFQEVKTPGNQKNPCMII